MKNKKGIITIVGVLIVCLLGVIAYAVVANNKAQKASLFKDNSILSAKDDLLSKQADMDKNIKEYADNKEYTLGKAKVIVNPYYISPLSGIIIFTTDSKTSINVEINGKTFTKMEESKSHIIPIYGLLANYENEVKLTTDDNKSKTYVLKTNEYKGNKLSVSKTTKTLNDEMYFVSGVVGNTISAYDKEGWLRWYLDSSFAGDIEFLENGHILLSSEDPTTIPESSGGIVEIDYLGKVYNKYSLKDGYQNAVYNTGEEYILIGGTHSSPSSNSFVYTINKEGKVTNSLDVYELLVGIDPTMGEKIGNSPMRIDSIDYNSTSKDLVLSLSGLSSVMSVNYETKKINWIFGNPKSYTDKFSEYMLNITDNSTYPKGQHSAFITKDGLLGFYNNDYDVFADTSIKLSDYKANYSSAKLFKIDGKNISKAWEYAGDKNMFDYALGNFQILSNDNKLINFGWVFNQKAYDEQIDILEAEGYVYARIIELDKDDNVLFDAKVDGGIYRAFKHNPLSKTMNNYEVIDYKLIDNTPLTDYEKSSISSIADELEKAPLSTFDFKLTRNTLTTNIIYDISEVVDILFVDGTNAYTVHYKEKDKPNLTTMNIVLPNGEYAIYFKVNGNYIKTGTTIKY